MPADNQAPKVIDRRIEQYRIVSLLGAGGMGEVYLAHDTSLDRRVALKLLSEVLQQDPTARKRFLREARSAAALDHPFICKIYETREVEGRAFIAMEYVQGQTLAQRLARGPFTLREILKTATEIAEALETAHKRGIIHRDLTPANIMLTEHGYAKVMDFGLAKHVAPIENSQSQEQPPTATVTGEGVTLGTLAYMSPEQLRGKTMDARSDIFSFGVVLHELVTGTHPFKQQSPFDTAYAILNETPAPLSRQREEVPQLLQRIVRRMLAKNAEERYAFVGDVANDLRECLRTLKAPTTLPDQMKVVRQVLSRPLFAFPIVVALVAVLGLSSWLAYRSTKVRWVREQAIPEITRLIRDDKYDAAVGLAADAERYIPTDPVLSQLWSQMSREFSITTTPPGAHFYGKEHSATAREWRYLGRTPLERVRVPFGVVRWKVEKDGFSTLERAVASSPLTISPTEPITISLTLDKEGSIPPEMVRIPGGVAYTRFRSIPTVVAQLTDYLIDKYEVTNKQFSEFVAAGGYEKREYWKHSFVKEARVLTWEQAMAEFRDATGRPGPSTWELGTYPTGQDSHPVAGVSWYEAAAYAEFAAKSLPSLLHWVRATGSPVPLAMITTLSNFGGSAPAPIGYYQGMGPFGTYDMAGNVSEWCWNALGDRRLLLGGAWNEPAEMFESGYSQVPFDRSPTNGFRCARYLGADAPPDAAFRPLPPFSRDYAREKPASDDMFRIYEDLYGYDQTALDPKTEAVDDGHEHWTRQKTSFNAAYSNERVTAYLFLPKDAAAPYQTLIYFPGADAFSLPSVPQVLPYTDFLMRSGRAVLMPVYKGTYERQDGISLVPPYTAASFRDHMIQWSKDLGRAIDYLESRPDIARDKFGYYGFRAGTAIGGTLVALEKRLKVAVFLAGGLTIHEVHPQADAFNFASRIRIPVLMVNGRYDHGFPLETSQKPFFRLLGTPEKDKRQVVFETQVVTFPRNQLIKEVLDWLDRYLGPTK